MRDDRFGMQAGLDAITFEAEDLKKRKTMEAFNARRGYIVFVHDYADKWDCAGLFISYGEAVACSEAYRKYGEVKILTDVWTMVREDGEE